MMSTLRMTLRASALALGIVLPASAQEPGAPEGARTTQPAGVRTPLTHTAPSFLDVTGDSTLERLIGYALGAGHDLQIAEARVRGARASRMHSALDLTPAIRATGGYTRQRMASFSVPGAAGSLPDQGLWDAGLQLAWEVDVFGRGRRSLQGQGELVSASYEDVNDVQVLLASEVAAAYFELRGAQDRLAVAARNAENQRGTLEITLQRLEGGSGTALDTERARAQLSATLADIPMLEATIVGARYRLGVLTARDPDALAPELVAVATQPSLPEQLTIASADSFVRRRPDVRSAERQLAAREAFVGAARAEYLPRVALAGGAGYTSGRFDGLGNRGTPRYAIGPVISWPALDFARVRAGVDAARADEAEAKARYEQAILRSRAEIETALVAYRRARERLQHLDDAAAASERAAELARLRFTEGASDFLQVLDAERSLLEAQDRRAVGRTSATTALVAVHRALGGVWPTSLSRR